MAEASPRHPQDSSSREAGLGERFQFFENNVFNNLIARDGSKKITPSNDKELSAGSEEEPAKKETEFHDSCSQERHCRICFGGEEDEDDLGKLISPCKCKGTMKYVHVDCLNAWRSSSASSGLGPKSPFFRCNNCLYKYHFSRAKVAKLVTSISARLFLSLLILLLLIFGGGYCIKYMFLKVEYSPRNLDPALNFTAEDIMKLLDMKRIDLAHFLFGTVFIGILGFFVFFVQMLLFGTLTVIGLRFPVFTYHRDTERLGIKDKTDPGSTAAILIAVVIIGICHSIYTIYTLVSKCSKKWLDALGAQILEVDDDQT